MKLHDGRRVYGVWGSEDDACKHAARIGGEWLFFVGSDVPYLVVKADTVLAAKEA